MSLSKKCLFLAFALVSMMAKAQDLAKKELVWEEDFEWKYTFSKELEL